MAVHPEWDAADDARQLRKAMKGLGTDNKVLINIVCGRDRDHLQKVRAEFQKNEKRDLVKDIKSETSGHYEDLVTGLVLSEAEYRAKVVHDACWGPGTDDCALIDVLCTLNGPQIQSMKAAYTTMFKKDPTKIVHGDTSGNYCKLLEALLTGRKAVAGVDQATMSSDLDALFRATEGKIGTDAKTMIEILSTRSAEHLHALNVAYVPKSKHMNRNFKDVIKAETSGNFQHACLALMELPHEWFTQRVFEACHGNGTDEKMLVRNLMLADAYQVQIMFQLLRERHNRDMFPYLKKELSGNLERAVVTYVETCLKP